MRPPLILTDSSHVLDLPAGRALLRDEVALASERAQRLPSGRSLWLLGAGAHSVQSAADAGRIVLRVTDAGFGGDAICTADALPWQDESFRLIVVQHAGDFMRDRSALFDELTRTLVPGGTLLWFGMNPWSPWLAWLQWQSRKGYEAPHTTHAETIRRRLLKREFAPVSIEFVGPCWPHGAHRSRLHDVRAFASLRGAYMVTAQKSRSVLTPLRPARAVRREPARAVLAALPSHRACA